MRDTTSMRRGRLGFLIASLTAGVAATASAMPPVNESLAPGWQAFVGCWEPVAIPGAPADTTAPDLVCVVPVEGTSAADMVTVMNGRIVARERVDATGTPSPVTVDDCTGTRTASWSVVGQRLFTKSDMTCGTGLRRTSTGVISMATLETGRVATPTALTNGHEWTDVQSVTVGEQKAVRVIRYREARQGAAIPAEVTTALGARTFSVGAARLAATAPVTSADIVDVARHLDAPGTEVWLLAQTLAFKADAKRLVELANAGVPGSVVDIVVALSFPNKFAIDVNQREVAMLAPAPREVGAGIGGARPMYDPMYDRYGRGYYSPYGYSSYGYGYDYFGRYGAWYPFQRPVVIVTNPTPAEP